MASLKAKLAGSPRVLKKRIMLPAAGSARDDASAIRLDADNPVIRLDTVTSEFLHHG